MPDEVTPASLPDVTDDSHTLIGDFAESIRDVRMHSELLFQLTLRDIRLRYKQSVMGFAWAILMPMLVVFAGIVIRLALSVASGSPFSLSDMGGIAVKSLPWSFFSGAVGFASGTLVGNANLVTKVSFPREVLPLAAVLTQAFDAALGAAVLAIALPLLGAQLSWSLLWAIPLASLLFLLTCALCLTLACANLFFRDVKYLVQVFLTFGIFFTPVLFDAPMLGEHWGRLIMLNPIAPLLEGFRLSIIEGHNLMLPLEALQGSRPHETWSPWYLAWVALCALVGSFVATALFRRLQYQFAERI